ncbi:disease resistance protein At4g27190-like isoform X1 [Argentina anserina]|uniref:disease resistance protein At4g27190-like isoform X1 n=1 Tax=Argentina anserina TaxID=57926 RepID=UPI0021762DDA|nr:disease resistance protein At4g27190-like isoform X1 [Potentilla anserina]XP_050371150.1 disease resistance protein At4g27190-like isoform X1 [Potentilla anserina]
MASSSSSSSSSSAQPSSSSTARPWKYDVFLSFRGPDTRRGIVSQLYGQLQKNGGIKTFMDDPDLQVGESISPTLLKAIEESRFAIVVLSPNYASSPWCLDELATICECMKEENRILPVFYDVEPSDVRHRKRSFEKAFKEHESSRRHTDKVQRWKEALQKVASFSGWDMKNYKTDGELVEKIVDFVRERIQPCGIIQVVLSTRDFEEFESRWEATKKVMDALTDAEVTAIGVYGMGGVGKTTLVKRVGSLAHENGVLNLVILAPISQTPNFKQIQQTLAEQLDFKLQWETETRRAVELQKKIMSKTKILIILDDIWERIDLSRIGIPSYEELKKCNSKVLFTTRRLHVCNTLESQTSIPLNILSEQESWKLFVKSAGRSFESPNFENVARKVARECRGLPIALTAVARALRGKELEEWNKASRRLEKSQSPTVDDKPDAFECIKFSYEYLKDEDHKSCFLLCCLFPEDDEIEIQDLFKYVVGTKFYREAETMGEARGTLVSIVKYLKDSSLLLDAGNEGRVKMHDVIRDTAIHIATSERGFWVKAGIGLECWPPRLDQGCTAISLMRNQISKLPEEELVCPRLQILLLNHNYALDEIPESFIKSLNELRVLDVRDTSISILPQSFRLLTNLQALYLDFCGKLIDISIVGKLQKLEILSAIYLWNLPREIGHLTNLRILHFRSDIPITIPCGVISKLHKLEELYLGDCEFEWLECEAEGRGEETKIGFGEIAGLSNLKRLHVGIPHHTYIPNDVEATPDWDYFSIFIRDNEDFEIDDGFGDHDSRSLILRGASISMLPDWFINAVANKIEKLRYSNCRGSLVMENPLLWRLHELKVLKVYGGELDDDGHEDREESVNSTERVQKGPLFQKLEELYLKDLEELWVGDLPHGSLVNLKVLEICPCAVKNVSKFVQSLPSLEKLTLSRVKQLESVFGCEGCELKESKLREVRLLFLYSMKSLCSGPAPRVMFQSIKILTIDGCGLLQSVFASEVTQCLSQLEVLDVQNCFSLERVIEEVKKEKTALPKLKKLKLCRLPKLYGASSGTVDIECPSLEHVLVVNCPHLPFSISESDFYFKYSERRFLSAPASDYFGSTNPVQLND